MSGISTTARRHRMRCAQSSRGCGRRFTLRRHPSKYVRPPRCPFCGSPWIYDMEASRRAEMKRKDTCTCSAYPFPHEAGTLRVCVQHPRYAEPLTDDEYRDYEHLLRQERGGSS